MSDSKVEDSSNTSESTMKLIELEAVRKTIQASIDEINKEFSHLDVEWLQLCYLAKNETPPHSNLLAESSLATQTLNVTKTGPINIEDAAAINMQPLVNLDVQPKVHPFLWNMDSDVEEEMDSDDDCDADSV